MLVRLLFKKSALAGVAHLVVALSQRVAGLIPSPGKHLGCGFRPPVWMHMFPCLGAYGYSQLMLLSRIGVSLSLPFSVPFSLRPKAINKCPLGRIKKKSVRNHTRKFLSTQNPIISFLGTCCISSSLYLRKIVLTF